MSNRLPETTARQGSENLAVLLREPFRVATELLHRRFEERGHGAVRPPHGAVMQFLDDDGTRVSVLAERAGMTKQSMGELVAHLERSGYVERVPDPGDRRARLVRSTAKGDQLYAIAREVVAEIEEGWATKLGERDMAHLRRLLEQLNAQL
jgi:DNA-binding MarR family transcriptional regulator